MRKDRVDNRVLWTIWLCVIGWCVLAWLDDHGIVVYDAVTRERIELKTPEGMMLNGIRCLWAQVERMRMGQRIKRVLDYQREHGLPWHGRPRYGFRRQRVETGGKRRTTWVRDERQWQLMAEIYELRQHKRWKFKDIVALFAKRGEMTADTGPLGAKGQKPWDYWRVYRAFRLYKKLVEQGQVGE